MWHLSIHPYIQDRQYNTINMSHHLHQVGDGLHYKINQEWTYSISNEDRHWCSIEEVEGTKDADTVGAYVSKHLYAVEFLPFLFQSSWFGSYKQLIC